MFLLYLSNELYLFRLHNIAQFREGSFSELYYISFLLYTLCMTPVSTKRFGAARRIPLMTGTPTASCSKLMLAGYTAAREQLLRVPWLRRVNTPESPFTRMLQATAVHGNLVLLYYRTLSLQLELI